jgi:hypothetical protein
MAPQAVHAITLSVSLTFSLQALAVAVNSGLVDYPVDFSKVWGCEGLAIWQPKAPDNYAALGCVITIDGKQPPLSSVVCVHSQVRLSSMTAAVE